MYLWSSGLSMVVRVAAILLCTSICLSSAIESPHSESKVQSGLYFILIPKRAVEVVKTTDSITYVLQTTNGIHKTVWLPDDQRLRFRMELFSTNGTAVPRTKLGREVGSKFEKIPLDWAKVKLVEGSSSTGYGIHRLVDLFRIREKGNYTLRFQLQLFVGEGVNSRRLVRFEPVDFRVVHE